MLNIDLIKEAIKEAEDEEAKRRVKGPKLKPQKASGRKAKAKMSNST